MLLLIDNYDSFTWNLVHILGESLAEGGSYGERVTNAANSPSRRIDVRRNDALTVEEALALKPEAIVISPGPGDPDRAGICVSLIRAAAPDIPILGVCLGHQAIGQAFGGEVVRAPEPRHGKTSPILHKGLSVFNDLPTPLNATRYHSLTLAPDTIPDCLEVTAESDDGVVMGVRHRAHPTHGVQFHPESIATDHGRALLKNFLTLAELA